MEQENENNSNGIYNTVEYYESITRELEAIKNRVRNWIGDKNWGEDGRYKENILISAIERVLPSRYKIGTGFIVYPIIRSDYKAIVSSTQIDIMIYDSHHSTLFKDDKFVIVDPAAVRGVIEVKTNLHKKKNLQESIKKLNRIGYQILRSGSVGVDMPPFLGIFGYNIDQTRTRRLETLYENTREALRENFYFSGTSEDISRNKHIFNFMTSFICYDNYHFLTMRKRSSYEEEDGILYRLEGENSGYGMAPAFFIGNLVLNLLPGSSILGSESYSLFPYFKGEDQIRYKIKWNASSLEQYRYDFLETSITQIFQIYKKQYNLDVNTEIERIVNNLNIDKDEFFQQVWERIKSLYPKLVKETEILYLLHDIKARHRRLS